MIPHSRPDIIREDSEVVAKVVKSGAIAQGEVVDKFEKAVASYVGVKGGVALSSGTSALHVALLAMGVERGDEVVLPTYVCAAPLNAVNYVGAIPVLADVDPETGNISSESAGRLIGPKTKAVIVPHMMGRPADLDSLAGLGVPILEDCAQSIGAGYRGQMTGSFGKAAICSFYATKVFACGEGGMVLSDDEAILAAIRDLRDYDEKTPYKVRFNYKMTDMHAALGLSQLKRLPEFIAARRQIAENYKTEFMNLPVSNPLNDVDCEPIYFRYVLRLKQDADSFIHKMKELNVLCRKPIYKPLHVLLDRPGLRHADKLYEESVSIPIYPALTAQEVEMVKGAVKKILAGRSNG